MKRFLALAALVLGLASCQTEPEGLDVIVGGEQEAVINVSLAETTRSSADSGIVNVDNNVYDLRYILEVYDKENDVFVYRDVQTVETDVKSVSFPVRLIPERDYNFVVWADFVEEGKKVDLYYTTTNGLDEVSIITSEWVQMDEARDAYTGNEIVTGYNSGKSINITLTRPFGKLRVITTDIDALNKLSGQPMPESITVTYTNKVYTAFNALTQTPMTESNKYYTYNLVNVYGEDWTTENRTLFTDYIFGTASGSIQFTMDVEMTNDNVVSNNFNTEIPVKRNYLTTITGDILTDGNNIKVDVSDDFENKDNPNNPPYYQETISSAADFFAAVNEGGEYIIISDITISSVPGTLATTRAAGSKSTTIDLNGYTITVENNTGAALITLTDGQTIVFEDKTGEGEIVLANNSAALINATDGCVVVEGGDVEENVVNGNFFEVESNEDSLALLQYICNNGGTFTFTRDIEGNVTVVQKQGVKVNIDGNGFKFNGAFIVHSNSNHYADAALTIKNVNFETATASTNIIEALEHGSQRYSTNITVEDCTFTATGEAVNTAVGVQIKSSKNAKVLNCTATDMHSLIQAQSCDESVLVQNCKVNGKNGVAFKQVKAATVEGTTIVATGYGIRFDGNTDNYGITVKDNTVTAAQPFIVRRMTSQNNTITLEGTNTLTTESAYQIVITNGEDDAAYAIPTGTYTLTGADGMLVYPRDVVVTTEDNLIEALKNNDGTKTIFLKNDIIVANKWDRRFNSATTSKPITIDGMGNTLKFNCEVSDGYNHHSAFRFEAPAVVKNLTIDMSETTAPGKWLRAISSHNELVVDNCTFIGNGNYSKANAVVFGDKAGSPQWDYTATITNSIFTNWSRGISDNENANELKSLFISGNTFTNAHAYMSAYESITFVGNVMTNSQVNITSYSNAANATVVATGNTLDNSQYNIIGAAGKKFDANNVDCQEGFTVNTL